VNEGEGTAEAVDRWEQQDNEMEAAGEDREEDAGMGEEEEEERVSEREENGELMGEDPEATAAEAEAAEVAAAEEAEAAAEEEADEEVKQLVEAGNMEQLANLVLNGEGHRLMGQNSDDPELQGFLNNVPAYMASFLTVTLNLEFCHI
jgi:hypothetical protein